MTKLYIFTGFLGSGKTTLLQELMRKMEGRRIGVIQNEFGKLSIDGEILKRDGIHMLEINRGSIFCTCLKLNFVEALAEMAAMDFEYLFVESSGIGDPSNVEEILHVVREAKGREYDFAGMICLVDAVNFPDQLDDEEAVNRQLKHSHLAVISKTDLVSPERINRVVDLIRGINPVCRIEIATNGDLDPSFLNDDLMQYQWAGNEPSTNSVDTVPKALMMLPSEPFKREDFEQFVAALAPKMHRLKGFVELADEGWHQVDVVGKITDYKPCEAKDHPHLVVISKIGPQIIRPLVNEWNDNVKTKMELKN